MTGFLGSGKTTLIARLLQSRGAAGTAVLINEVGEIAIDDKLVEHVTDDVQVLASGCLCCTLRDDLAGAIARVEDVARATGRAIERVVIETSGVADPAPIVHSVARDPRLAERVRVAGVVAVVDVSRALALLDAHAEVARQIDLADRIVLTKHDVAPPGGEAAVREELRTRFAGREVVDAGDDVLLAAAPRIEGVADAMAWLGPHVEGAEIGASARANAGPTSGAVHPALHVGDAPIDRRTIELDGPVALDALALWHRIVTGLDGLGLLRIKGIVEADGAFWVMQSAQHAVFPPKRLPAAPRGWTGSRLVVLSRGLDAAVLDRMEEAARLAARGERR